VDELDDIADLLRGLCEPGILAIRCLGLAHGITYQYPKNLAPRRQ
jgi:hypothetical protein